MCIQQKCCERSSVRKGCVASLIGSEEDNFYIGVVTDADFVLRALILF